MLLLLLLLLLWLKSSKEMPVRLPSHQPLPISGAAILTDMPAVTLMQALLASCSACSINTSKLLLLELLAPLLTPVTMLGSCSNVHASSQAERGSCTRAAPGR